MKNFKINTNRPPLSDADLAGKGDFNQLFKTYKAMKTPFFKTPKFWFGSSAVLVASIAAIIIYAKLADMGNEPAPFINPPMAQADIKSDAYIIDAGADSNLTYSSGSKIHIPANAFIDENGTPVKGKVELKYREFKKASDVFLAGIPMTYDSAGEQFHFETAGMMEISASQNGKPLKTNPNAFITVDMVSNNAEDKFNTYYLDTTKREWIYLAQKNYNGKKTVKQNSEGELLFSANCAVCHSPVVDMVGPPLKGVTSRWENAGTYKEHSGVDWLRMYVKNERMPQSEGYKYAINIANSRGSAHPTFSRIENTEVDKILAFVESADSSVKCVASTNPYNPYYRGEYNDKTVAVKIEQFSKVQKEIAQLEQQKPVEPKKITKEKHRFNIKVDEKEFPEIAVYNNMKFEVNDKAYNPEKAKVLWEDVSLKRIEGTTNYEITFSNAKENYKVVATPVFEDKDIKGAQKIYEEKYKEYQTKLSKRKADEAKLKTELEARAEEAERKIQKEIAEMAQRRKDYEARLAQSELVYRTFQVADFGIWNCDCPNRLPNGATVIAKLKDAKTKNDIQIQSCYLVEKGRNVMFTYYPQTMTNFRFDPTKENMIWAVTNDLKVAIIKPEQFKASKRTGGEMQLELNVIDKKFESSEEVKEYLEI